ncbi:hypothetical protein HYQ44_011218 [Verticillium longisporum]|nr:hypothetical protein HYQ44_011218 [Verticillium longisporum]
MLAHCPITLWLSLEPLENTSTLEINTPPHDILCAHCPGKDRRCNLLRACPLLRPPAVLSNKHAYRAQSTATPKPWSGVWQLSACWFTVVAITFVSWARPSREPRPDPVPLLSSLSGLARQVRSTSGTVQYALERPF